MKPPAIRCFGLSKNFGAVEAVSDIDLAVPHSQTMVLLGPSGCGKSTLLRLIAGFELPDSGTLAVGGQMVSGPNYLLPPEKRRVGIVFQDYALFPHLNVLGNVNYGIRNEPMRAKVAGDILNLVGLTGKEHRMPHELSGGEQQRVALARALAPRPAVLLLDEPFSNQDATLRLTLRRELRQILVDAQATSIFVTHDQEEALFMGDQIAIMTDGRIQQIGHPENIFHRPATPFVASFMGIADFLQGNVDGGILVTDLGVFKRLQGMDDDANVRVMVRPDDISIRSDKSSPSVVVGRVFQGGHYLYRIRLPSGAEVHSLMGHHQFHEIGTTVNVRIDAGHEIMCFVDGEIRLLSKITRDS